VAASRVLTSQVLTNRALAGQVLAGQVSWPAAGQIARRFLCPAGPARQPGPRSTPAGRLAPAHPRASPSNGGPARRRAAR